MPYMISGSDGMFMVYKQGSDKKPVGAAMGKHKTRKEAMSQMRALYANEKKSLPNTVGNILSAAFHDDFTETADILALMGYINQDQRIQISSLVGDALGAFNKGLGDIAGIIVQPDDVDYFLCDDDESVSPDMDDTTGMDMSGGAMTGMMSTKPPAAQKGKSEQDAQKLLTSWLVAGSKALYDTKSEFIWAGVSHNAWQDRLSDILPLKLIEKDIASQKAWIKSGKLSQFGYGLWLDHDETKVIGTCTTREIVPGGRSCFEMGELQKSEYAPMTGATMSIGYNYSLKGEEYDWIVVYERSALKATRAINARTFWNVHRRQVLSDAALQKASDELLAAAME